MPMSGNPRKNARDIGDGFVRLTPVMFRGRSAADPQALRQAVEWELRDTHGQQAPAGDLPVLQARQRRILRLNQALSVLRTYQDAEKPHPWVFPHPATR